MTASALVRCLDCAHLTSKRQEWERADDARAMARAGFGKCMSARECVGRYVSAHYPRACERYMPRQLDRP